MIKEHVAHTDNVQRVLDCRENLPALTCPGGVKMSVFLFPQWPQFIFRLCQRPTERVEGKTGACHRLVPIRLTFPNPPDDVRFLRLSSQTTTKSDDDVRCCICKFVASCSLMTTCRITTTCVFVKHPSLTTSHQSDPCELRHASAATIRPPCSMATAWAPATHLPRRAAH